LTQGTLAVAGLYGRVRIHRDRWGIPLIEADDPRDGSFALGFCHGQDRAFQLELLLRIGRGTLAEMVGEAALLVDRLSRRIGFHRTAKEQWAILDADIRESLEGYARGVQAGVTLGCPRVPHEFVLLRTRPTSWTPIDTLALTKLLSFTLTANWDAELVRLKVLTSDGPQVLQALDATYPDWHLVTSAVGKAAGQVVDRLADDLSTFFTWMQPGGGSNNWAVAGSRTATGRPILANDPHLDASLPAHWYLSSLRTPNEMVAGATFVGGPAFLIGHNGHVAWGVTAGLVDNTDLFLEEIGPDGTSVRQGDGFAPCRIEEEVIPIKGRQPVVERILITPRGPIISPALVETKQALSLRATWLDPLPMTGFFRINQVKSFAEFRQAFAHWPIASQNVVYADVSGTIGWQLVGRSPIRKKGHGTIPLPGRDPEVGWHHEAVPFEQMPFAQNPPDGFIATANNRPIPDGHGPFVGVDFIDGYRLLAIERGLRHRSDWDIMDTMKLQMDQYAIAWEEMREIVLAAPVLDEDVEVALELLRSWDGRVTASSVPAAIYELFLAEMLGRVARAKAPQSWRWVIGAGLSPITPYNFGCFRRTAHLVRLLREQPTGWFTTSWSEVVATALGAAVMALEVRQGHSVAQWAWGRLRPLMMHHPLSKRPGLLGKALGKIFNLGPVPCGGDTDVINQAAVLPLSPLSPSDNIASLRAVIDVGAWQNSRFAMPGGQSGNPLSPHYEDLFYLWQRGEGVPIAFTPEEVRQAKVHTLELRPNEPRAQ
jgi:penicillin amidase